MHRFLFLAVVCCLLAAPPGLRADAFDRYLSAVLEKAPTSAGVKEVKQLTPDMIGDNDRVLPKTNGALLIVKTNEARFSKLLVQAARQKVNDTTSLPILLIERYVTYQEGEERAVEAAGQNVKLFNGFRLSLDIGQIVPAELGGDLQFVAEGDKVYLQPVGKAKLYLVTKPLPGTEPKKSTKPVVGDTFQSSYFNGTYHLHDDGRRSGRLKLQVDESGDVSGAYYSDKDGKKYDVYGKIGPTKNAITFTIKFPRVEQIFQGLMFTGDASAIAGSSRLQEQPTAFYALRTEEE